MTTDAERIAAVWDIPLSAAYEWRTQMGMGLSALPGRLICMTCGELVPDEMKARKGHTHERLSWTFRLLDSYVVTANDAHNITTLMAVTNPQATSASEVGK